MTAGLIDFIDTPAQGNKRPAGLTWCADNGCFGKGYPGDDAAATLARSVPWLPKIRALGYPAALVAQDGLEDLDVPWDQFDVLFIGGTTAWKLGAAARALVAEAKARGKRVHMGRVNSEKRYRYAQAIGCDSADGTTLAKFPDATLPDVLAWLRLVDHDRLVEVTA